MASQPSPVALLLGISGPSSSGKTTISRLLRDVFPNSEILHEDDFYRPEDQLPMRAGFRDWDCAGAIDIPALVKTLRYIKTKRSLPLDLDSKEDRNDVGEGGVSSETIKCLQREVIAWAKDNGVDFEPPSSGGDPAIKLFIIDGFLLFGQSVQEVRAELDVKILLRAKYKDTKKRREARSGYVTLEGFWEDPPGYVDQVVWPGYVEEHGFLFKDKDVHGEIEEEIIQRLGIRVCPGDGDWEIERMLVWVIGRIKKALIE